MELESWVDWIKRVTHEADAAMRKAEVPDWIEEVRRRAWKWAGHVARRTDGRWTRKVLGWKPEGVRRPWRPMRRWTDGIDELVRQELGDDYGPGSWQIFAQDRDGWFDWEGQYVKRLTQ